MRKLISAIIIVILIVMAAPSAMGLWFEYRYQKFLASINLQKDLSIHVEEYHRGWLSSDAKVHVRILNPELQYFLLKLGIPEANFDFTMTQTIQHGPLLYRYTSGLPCYFGIAALHQVFHFKISPPIQVINTGMLTFRGNYFTHFSFFPGEFTLPNGWHVGINEGVASHVWIYPNENKIKGAIILPALGLNDIANSLSIAGVMIQFDQALSESGLWLGTAASSISSFNVQNNNGNHVYISNISLRAADRESHGQVSGTRELTIGKFDFGPELFGPVRLKVSATNLNAEAIVNMIAAYRKITFEGELYRQQLQRKMSLMFPQIFNPRSQVKVESFDLAATEGNLQITGSMHWPYNVTPASDMLALYQDTYALAKVRISHKLLDKVIENIAWLPRFRAVSSERQSQLIELDTHIQTANQRNYFFILSLVKNRYLSEDAALELLNLQKNGASILQYYSLIKKLFLAHLITKEVSYALFWQYLDVAQQIGRLNQALDADQLTIQQQMRAQVAAWIKQGYITNDHNDNVVMINKENGVIKANGKEI